MDRAEERKFVEANRDEIINWFVGGQSCERIARRFKFIGARFIRQTIKEWVWDVRNADKDYHELIPNGHFSESRWRIDCLHLTRRKWSWNVNSPNREDAASV